MRNIPNEYAISAVENYISELDDIGIFYGYSFQQLCYMKGAAHEILDRLCKSEHIPPIIVIENFQRKMEALALLNPHTSWIFSIMSDAADYIVNGLIS